MTSPFVRSLGRLAAVSLAALAFAACSFVDSSESISKSIASPFESSSSSSPEGSESAYRNDVRDYTYAFAKQSRTDRAAVLDGMPKIAKDHGISNWEADRSTWLGIGEGLGKAKVSPTELELYKQSLAGSDAARAADIQSGYSNYRSN